MKQGRVTLNVLTISRVFLQASSTCVFTGYGIAKALNMDTTTVWETLRKLEERGWLTSEFETSGTPGRPPKRLYSMTAAGRDNATGHLAALQITPMAARSA